MRDLIEEEPETCSMLRSAASGVGDQTLVEAFASRHPMSYISDVEKGDGLIGEDEIRGVIGVLCFDDGLSVAKALSQEKRLAAVRAIVETHCGQRDAESMRRAMAIAKALGLSNLGEALQTGNRRHCDVGGFEFEVARVFADNRLISSAKSSTGSLNPLKRAHDEPDARQAFAH